MVLKRALQVYVLSAFVVSAGLSWTPAPAFSQSRFFIPDFHVGSGVDTQLLINNKSDHDGTVDIWAFSKTGDLFGQAQLGLKAHATRSFTLSELFGKGASEKTGWMAALSNSETSELSYRIVGTDVESEMQEADSAPARQISMDVPANRVLRLSNPSAVKNTVTVRSVDKNRAFLGLKEVSLSAFGQSEVALPGGGATHVEMDGTGDFLAYLGVKHKEASAARSEAPAATSESVMALVIDSETPVGAFQVRLHYDPRAVQFVTGDIEGGTSPGFDSKPLAIGIDNEAGEMRIASFQLGNRPSGRIDVAHLHVRSLANSAFQFEMKVEEITNLTGESILPGVPTIRLIRVN
jgi:hypothetical protein